MVQSQTAILKKEIKDIVAQIVASEMPTTERYKWGFDFLNNPRLQDINDAMKYIQDAADDGNVEARFFLAKLRFDGEYIEQNYGILNFNCVLRTLQLEQENSVDEFCSIFAKYPTCGFSTYGEIYLGHINQTATMLIFK